MQAQNRQASQGFETTDREAHPIPRDEPSPQVQPRGDPEPRHPRHYGEQDHAAESPAIRRPGAIDQTSRPTTEGIGKVTVHGRVQAVTAVEKEW